MSLTRRTPLRRSKVSWSAGARSVPIARKRTEPRRQEWGYADALEEARVYMERVRALPCAARGLPRHACTPTMHAHHAGVRGLGQKAHYSTCIPLCSLAHTCWHDAKGFCSDWTKAERAAWAAEKIAETRQRLGWTGAA